MMSLINCTERKREFRVHSILSNGQHYNLYLKKHSTTHPHIHIHGIWQVGLCVSNSRKEANRWYNKRFKSKKMKQTGQCGLEALMLAKNHLLEFAKLLSYHSEIQVGWEDDKRKRAYRRLLKYGFVDCGECYTIRNPDIWKFNSEVA